MLLVNVFAPRDNWSIRARRLLAACANPSFRYLTIAGRVNVRARSLAGYLSANRGRVLLVFALSAYTPCRQLERTGVQAQPDQASRLHGQRGFHTRHGDRGRQVRDEGLLCFCGRRTQYRGEPPFPPVCLLSPPVQLRWRASLGRPPAGNARHANQGMNRSNGRMSAIRSELDARSIA